MDTIGKFCYCVFVFLCVLPAFDNQQNKQNRVVISTAHELFLDREHMQFKMPKDWSSFQDFLKSAGYTGDVTCALLMQVCKSMLKVRFCFF